MEGAAFIRSTFHPDPPTMGLNHEFAEGQAQTAALVALFADLPKLGKNGFQITFFDPNTIILYAKAHQ